MNRSGVTVLRVLLIIAAVLAAIVLFFAQQLWLSIPFAIFAAIVALAALFSRAKTPTD